MRWFLRFKLAFMTGNYNLRYNNTAGYITCVPRGCVNLDNIDHVTAK